MKYSDKLYAIALRTAMDAGNAIMHIYNQPFEVDNKADGSPITLADKQSNQIIATGLEPTGIPLISEEFPIPDYEERKNWPEFWLVDPLDGTREFVKRNGEFTVNIALIQNNRPVLGILTAPALNFGYIGIFGLGSWKIPNLQALGEKEFSSFAEIRKELVPLSLASPPPNPTLATSRSHIDSGNEEMYEIILGKNNPYQTLARGSALKFGLLAEGQAHFYMRKDRIWEWDTAAGHALLRACGGEMLSWPCGQEFLYNKPEVRNPAFVACTSAETLMRLKGKFPLQKGI